MLILLRGLSSSDVHLFTNAFVASGQVYDYRRSGRALIRRYPTGALSEKTALILPSMIAAMRGEVPVATSFLVARSLSFTGGTWDKLSSIPGFTFPKPGEETLKALEKCGVAMTITHHDVNPADKILYPLRSCTGTVESEPLIISSIVSKQLSFPVDQLLLDVRYGEGTFLSDHSHAKNIANAMLSLLHTHGVPTTALFTDTPWPNGSSLGNPLEVAEAIALLRGRSHFWNVKGLNSQVEIVCRMFAQLFSETFPERSFEEWHAYGKTLLESGRAYNAFWSILRTHSVSEATIQTLMQDPWKALLGETKTTPIISPQTGIVKKIDQKNLGFFVNFTLNSLKGGIRLNKLPEESVSQGEPLCWVIAEEWNKKKDFDVRSCFTID